MGRTTYRRNTGYQHRPCHPQHRPASTLRPKEEVKVVRYMVARNDWTNASERQR